MVFTFILCFFSLYIFPLSYACFSSTEESNEGHLQFPHFLGSGWEGLWRIQELLLSHNLPPRLLSAHSLRTGSFLHTLGSPKRISSESPCTEHKCHKYMVFWPCISWNSPAWLKGTWSNMWYNFITLFSQYKKTPCAIYNRKELA